MSLRQIAFKSVYKSKSSSLVHDFLIPALEHAVTYNRAVGYFSSSLLAYIARGISGLVKNNGIMRLVVGSILSEQEFQAVKDGAQQRQYLEKAEAQLLEALDCYVTKEEGDRLKLLCYLVAANKLEIKIALTAKGMFHDKTGVVIDADGDRIVFQGSANETTAALLPEFNYESIAVYPSWKPEIYQAYGREFEVEFEKLWANEAEGVLTVEVLSSTYELLKARAPTTPPNEAPITTMMVSESTRRPGQPFIPDNFGGRPYFLRPHQIDAITKWRDAKYRGIFNMATGAGKTVTALHAAVDAFASIRHAMALIIIVPYQNLADQWCEVAEQFGFKPIRAYRSQANWLPQMTAISSSLLLPGNERKYCVVTVKNTLSSHDFQRHIAKIPSDRTMVIGDECHHYSSASYSRSVPTGSYMIGLSATPWRKNDLTRRNTLESIFGEECFSYTIDDAMRDDVLCRYQYIPHLIYLEEDEYNEYEELSKEISRLFSMRENGLLVDDDALNSKLMARARILGSANAKFLKLSDLLFKSKPTPKTLFYCGDGSTEDLATATPTRDIERVGEILHKNNWRSSKFTASESKSERDRILSNFTDDFIEALVSIRVLDEGIDIPSCSTAFLLASSRNERQYVQRRGRILRKSTGKNIATIHDFICLPPPGLVDGIAKGLVSAELMRFNEFSRLAENASQSLEISNGLRELFDLTEEEGQSESDEY